MSILLSASHRNLLPREVVCILPTACIPTLFVQLLLKNLNNNKNNNANNMTSSLSLYWCVIHLSLQVLFAITIRVSVAVPIVRQENDFNDFKDSWDYKITPHREPLLRESIGNHILPPTAKTDYVVVIKDEPRAKRNDTRISKKLGESVRSRISCSRCKLGVGLLQKAMRKGDGFEEIKPKFINICAGLKLATEEVCSGIIDVFGPELLPVVNITTIGPLEICSLCLGETCGPVENPLHEWIVKFPNILKPPIQNPPLPQTGLPTFKVLHISDTHYDPDYVRGSPAVCAEPLCCRSTSTPPTRSKVATSQIAGKWGSYGSCDSPRILLENMVKNIAEQHNDIDYIIWTGDLPPHDIWSQTKESNLNIVRDTTQILLEAFPDVPIFPALGNHESVPAGSFAPPWQKDEDHSISWLYNEVSYLWEKWLPSSINNSFAHGGFYSVLVRPGFRLISLNMNYCHTLSWWLLLNSTDPAKELQWLIYELQEAENNKEKVHIIGHIPPGASDCMKVWSRNYYEIVERYESTIAAQFFGHTHADEFEVFYDTMEYKRPTSIAYIGPSVTTYENFNPGYRIYYVDGDHETSTKEVLDHETWIMDLNKANENEEEPTWRRLYSAKEAYSLKSLRPTEWSNLIQEMVDNDTLFQLFYRYYYKDSPVRPDCKDSKCMLQILCDLRSAKSHDRRNLCHDLELAV